MKVQLKDAAPIVDRITDQPYLRIYDLKQVIALHFDIKKVIALILFFITPFFSTGARGGCSTVVSTRARRRAAPSST